jgi:hypothetical protein
VQLILVAVGALFALLALKAWQAPDAGRRRKLAGSAVGVLIAGAVLLITLRFGAHWLAVLAAGSFALLRAVLPLAIRLLPWFGRLRPRRQATPSGQPNAHRTAGGASEPSDRLRMSRKEALAILGLEEGAKRDDVLGAYRALMKRIHPDVGGPAYLAAKINEAKEVLLS